MKSSRTRRFALSIAALSILASACGGDDSGSDASGDNKNSGQINIATTTTNAQATTTSLTPKAGGSITMGMFSETAGLDPVVTNGGGTTGTTEVGAIFDALMRFNPETKKYEPQIAESLTGNADNTEWTLKLRPNVKFSDGTDFDSAAVVYGMKRHTQFGSRAASLLSSIKEYTEVDKLTVKFTLSAPWANFPYVLAYTPGMIPSPTAVKAACGANHETPARNCAFNNKPIGAGPYKVDSYKPKESINLVRNDTYWGGKPYLDSLKFVVLAGAPQSYDALNTGTLQVAFLREAEIVKKAQDEKKVDAYINLQWAGGVALLNNGKVTCRNGLPASVCAGKPDGVITLETITSDKRIRQAVGFALDLNAINTRANAGAGFPGGELFQKGSSWQSASPVNSFDLAKAKALVDEVKKEGKWDGSIRVNCHNAPSRQSWAQTFQALLTNVGFTVKLKNDYDVNGLVADVLNNKTYDVACWGFNVSEEAPEVQLLQAVASTSAANAMNLVNLDMDAQIKIIREGKTDAERKGAMEKLQQLWKDEMPTPIYEALVEMIAWNKNVKGIKPTVATVVLFDKAWINS